MKQLHQLFIKTITAVSFVGIALLLFMLQLTLLINLF